MPQDSPALPEESWEDLLDEARRNHLDELHLRNMGLDQIPPEVFEMEWLRWLDLSINDITSLPEDIARLKNLEHLDLWNNHSLDELPERIGELSELRSLSIGRGCSHLPDSLGRCTKLQQLAIGGNDLTSLPHFLSQFHDLEELQIWGNLLTHLPDWWEELPQLRILNLADNRLSTLPSTIGVLRKLTSLRLDGNKLTHLPDVFGNMKHLKHLDLAGNNLLSLPPSLGALTKLETLDASGNQLSDLPDSFGGLTSLISVDFRGNRFPLFPVAATHWDKLRTVDLRSNRLVSIPTSIERLKNIETLELQDNDLSELPEALSRLQSLRIISLGLNRFQELPEEITKLRNLEVLDLNSEATVRAIHQKSHTSVWVEKDRVPRPVNKSRLEILPLGLKELPSLRVLLLFGNPMLGLPDEVIGRPDERSANSRSAAIRWDRSVGDLLDYYFRTRGGAQPLNEAKLILLGWGGAGKTSLINRLVYRRFDPEEVRTEGIEVTSWQVMLGNDDEVRLNIWDFGGQEIMHATHQFFLTTRSLYLIVLNGRAGSADADLDYWLRIVDSFAPESPVIVVLNQIVKDPFEIDENGMLQKHPTIRAFIKTDCATGEGLGIDELERRILAETDRLPDLRVNFPAAWFEIKNRLATMSENYLTFEHYRDICSELGENESTPQEQLANYLHSLGIALNFRDDHRLRDTHVLNPHWVTEGIYSILNSRLAADRGGEITLQDLSEILDSDRYPSSRHGFLLDLMRKFELCFPFPEDESRYLVADLLPKQQPDEVFSFPIAYSLQFEFRYPVLPEGLLPRFIVRSHIHSVGQPRWRNGVVLRWEQTSALVKADAPNRLVQIAVTGPSEGRLDGRRRLLAVIRSDFEHIHRSYRFRVGSFVPVRNHPGFAVEYEKLLAAETEDMRTFPEYFGGQFIQVDVAELLQGVNVEIAQVGRANKRQAKPRPARLFISYSHRDEVHRQSLESHLKVLQMARLVEVWHDRRIDPGDEWKGEIDAELEAADIVVLLVSADFLASDYCNDVEVPRALARHEEGTCRVIPVIVRDSRWQLSPIAKLQALPTDGRAVATWPNVDTAWREVAEGIESVIERFQT